jgi:hypothetical protein
MPGRPNHDLDLNNAREEHNLLMSRGYDRELTRRTREIVRAFNLYKQGSRCQECGESHPACLMFYDTEAEVKVSISYAKRNWRDGDAAFEKLRQCKCYCSNCFAKTFERTELQARGFRAWIVKYKREHGCVKCKEDDPVCLEFHHIDPWEKETNISQCKSKQGALKEIEKCEILCLKCHDALHWEEDKCIN